MPLQFVQAPTPGSILPAYNCTESLVKVTATDYLEDAGGAPNITPVFTAGVLVGDYIDFPTGDRFYFVAGPVETANEILYDADPNILATNAMNTILAHPNITQNWFANQFTANSVTFCANDNYEIVPFVYGSNSPFITFTGIAPPYEGAYPQYKDNFYVFWRVLDKVTNQYLCVGLENETNTPVFLTNDTPPNIAFYDAQSIIQNVPELSTQPPSCQPTGNIFQTTTELREYCIQAYATYNEDEGCEKTYTPIIQVDDVKFLGDFISTCDNEIEQYIWNSDPVEKKFLTTMPDDLFFCHTSCFELGILAGESLSIEMFYFITYQDGSSSPAFAIPILIPTEGKYIIFLKPDGFLNSEEIAQIEIIATDFITGQPLARKTINFYHSNDKCCNCVNEFKFLSRKSNNDLIEGQCNIIESLEFVHKNKVREVACCAVDGGNTQFANESNQRTFTSIIFAQDADYLEEFLLSPRIYLWDNETEQYRRINSVNASYVINRTNENKHFIEYQYYYSVTTPTLSI